MEPLFELRVQVSLTRLKDFAALTLYLPHPKPSLPSKLFSFPLYIKKKKIQSTFQHDFLLLLLLLLLQGIYDHWDNQVPSDVIYLDFRKAIDKVPHERLLKKNKFSGYWKKLDCVDKKLAYQQKTASLTQRAGF